MYMFLFLFVCFFPCRHKSASVIGLYNRPQRSTFDTDVTSPSHGRKVGHLISRDPDGSQVIELVKPPAGPFGFYIARGTYDFGSGEKRDGRKRREGWNSIQIMNVYECNGTNIFMRWKMKCSIQRGEAELNGTFHLSPNENICSIARMRKHSLFVLYNLYKDSNS